MGTYNITLSNYDKEIKEVTKQNDFVKSKVIVGVQFVIDNTDNIKKVRKAVKQMSLELSGEY